METKDNTEKVQEKKTTSQNMLWNSAGSLVFLGFQWLITIVIVRLSDGFDAAGELALAMAIYNIVAPLAIFRMYTYQVSDVRRENSTGEYLSFRLFTCILAALVGFIYGTATSPSNTYIVILLYLIYRFSSLLIDVLHGADQLHSRMDYVGKSLILQGIGSFVSFCLFFWLSQSLEIALLSMTAATIAVGIFFDLPHTLSLEPIKIGISLGKVRHLFFYCLPIVVAAIACSSAPSIPRQYLSFLEGDAALGIYASVAAPVSIIQMGASYIYNPLLSNFSDLYARREVKQLLVLLGKVTLGIFALGVIFSIVLNYAGPLMLELLFGKDITNYSYLLGPLIVCAMVTAYVWFISDIFVSFRLFNESLISNAIALILSAILTFPLVSTYSMNGVSFVGIIGSGVTAALMGAFLIRHIIKLKKNVQR